MNETDNHGMTETEPNEDGATRVTGIRCPYCGAPHNALPEMETVSVVVFICNACDSYFDTDDLYK